MDNERLKAVAVGLTYVSELLSAMHEALGSIPSPTHKKVCVENNSNPFSHCFAQ
jgi:hypothetical protein